MLSHSILGFGLALLTAGWFARYVLACLSLPSAPGPWFAKWSTTWYIRKVWQGNFEAWNINAHKGGVNKIVRIAPRMYSIDDPAMATVIYGISSIFPKTSWYDAFADPGVPNHNLFSARNRTFHGVMRRKVANMYSMTTIKSYEPYVNDCIDLLLERFDQFADNGQVVDLQLWMQCYAFDVIGDITFGQRIGFLESGGKDIDGIMQALEDSVAFATLGGLSTALLPILFARYGNPARGLTAFSKKLHAESAGLSLERKNGGETFTQKLKPLRKQAPDDYEKYRLETITLTGNVAAGSDTTSISLTTALYYILTTDGVSTRLYEEICPGGSPSGAEERITFDQAQKLPYLQMVIKEALRVHPAVGLPMWREVVGEPVIMGETRFPPGAIIGINPWVAHMNSDVFGANAKDYVPERWDPQVTPPGRLALMEKYYLPFGAGSRTCIGKHISQLEMVKLIPELIKRYEFECVTKELKYANRWFVKPREVLVRLKRRDLS